MVQTAHAVADFAVQHCDEFKAWQYGSNYLCCLSTDQIRLQNLIEKLHLFGVKHTVFREPDIGNEITAVAVESLPNQEHKRLFRNFKLTLS